MTFSRTQWVRFVGIATLLASIAIGHPLAVAAPLTGAEPSATAGLSAPPEMNWFEAFVLGMVQGLTEFIPISSTAHLKVVPVLLGWGDPGVSFSAVIQLGSIAAVLWYFRQDLGDLSNGALRAVIRREYDDPDFRIVLGIILGTIPIACVGLLLKASASQFYEQTLRSLTAIAIVSIVMSALLALAERIGRRKRHFGQLELADGVLMGLAQTMALIPGVSRSGSTITAGLYLGLDRASAARFSFLLGIPAITLAGLVELKDLLAEIASGSVQSGLLPLGVGLLSSTVFSYAAISWLIQFLQKRSTFIFVWYRLAFGVALLAIVFSGVEIAN
ncbi:undecaprenyl-diphosphate phosphatase [Oxynema sp. CENA135]|nr:undecaprenyl-diphosphate phosphatase [Oxynema sp. CENA135]